LKFAVGDQFDESHEKAVVRSFHPEVPTPKKGHDAIMEEIRT